MEVFMMKKWILVGVIFLVAGCSQQNLMLPVSGEIENKLATSIVNSDGKGIGTAELTETKTGVKIRLMLSGLEPGKKAIHFHEVGKCVPPTFKSAGAHVNPAGKEHGFDNSKGYHAGDLPNLNVSKDGKVDLEIITPNVTLKKGLKNSLLDEDGSAIIIHEKEDDYVTDPSGNSGSRIACGIID
jgi:Cu-Zn family superoxide dismutase